jgi:hypothetical protein
MIVGPTIISQMVFLAKALHAEKTNPYAEYVSIPVK